MAVSWRQADLPKWLHGVTACLAHNVLHGVTACLAHNVRSTFLLPTDNCDASHLFLAHTDAVAPAVTAPQRQCVVLCLRTLSFG